MLNTFWPILLVAIANTTYNICAKSTPANINPFATLCITYLVAACSCVGMFFLTSPVKNLVQEVAKINWTSFVFGLVVVALEFGYINIFRVGWKVSTASLVTNIILACALLLVGFFVYKESISLRQIIGMLVCLLGLVLISK